MPCVPRVDRAPSGRRALLRAAVAAALATGKFAFATGSVINLDGGLSIGRL